MLLLQTYVISDPILLLSNEAGTGIVLDRLLMLVVSFVGTSKFSSTVATLLLILVSELVVSSG